MTDNSILKFAEPGTFTDSLTEVLRNGARALLTQAVEAEVAGFLAKHADLNELRGHNTCAPGKAGGFQPVRVRPE